MFRTLYEGLVGSLAELLKTPHEKNLSLGRMCQAPWKTLRPAHGKLSSTWLKTPSSSRSFPALIKSSPLISHHEHNSQRRNFWSWTVYFFCSWAVDLDLNDSDSGTYSDEHDVFLMFARTP